MIFLALACLLPNFLPIQLISSQTDKLIFLLFWTSFLQCLWLVVLTSCQRRTSERFSIISSQDGVDLGWLLIGENQPLKGVNTTTKIDDFTTASKMQYKKYKYKYEQGWVGIWQWCAGAKLAGGANWPVCVHCGHHSILNRTHIGKLWPTRYKHWPKTAVN